MTKNRMKAIYLMKKAGLLRLLPAMCLLLFVNCNGDDPVKVIEDKPVEVTFPAGSLKESWSGAQATDVTWAAGDAVGIYVLPADGTVLSAAKEKNRKYTVATGGSMTLSDGGSTISYPTNGDGIRFMAYYPYGTVTADYKRTFNLADQSTKAKKEAVDFGFYRGTTNYNKSSSTPALTFEHKFSKLLLTIKKGTGGPDVKNVAVKLSNTPSSAEVNLATLTTTDASAITTSGTADITAYTNSGAGTNDEVIVEAIVAPHSGKSGRVLTFTTSDKARTCELDGSLAFEAGKVYALDVTLNDETVVITGDDYPVEVAFPAGSLSWSGTTGTIWTTGDEVGVYVLPADGTVLSAANEKNRKYTVAADGGASLSDDGSAIYYPTNGDGIRFMAYYPYGTVTADYKRTFNLADQSTKAKKEALDFGFYRGTTNYNKSSSTPALTFEHKFSKLLLTIKKGAGGPAVKNVAVKLSNTPSSAEVNLATLATTDASAVTTSGTADITAYTNSDAGTNDEVTVEAIVAPHSGKSGRVLTFTTSDKARTYELDGSLAFEAGKVYALDVTLNDETVVITGDDYPVEVTFPAGSLSWSGTTGTIWTTGDEVGVYVLPADGTVLSAAKENNRKYTVAADGGAALSDDGSTIYYPMNGDGIRFMAYYPYGTVTDYKRTFSLTDQSTKAKKEAVDFGFYRGTTNYSRTNSTPALTFEHKFSKLLLTIKKGAGGPDVKNVTVKLSNTPSSAEVNLATLATTDASAVTTSGTAEITAYTNSGAGTNDEVIVEAIVAPHSAKSGRVLTFTTSDKTRTYELSSSLAFEAGKVYTLDITLEGDPVEVTFPAGSLKESWSGAQATDISWAAGDAVGVYVLPADGTVLSAAKENNRKYTVAAGGGATLSDDGSAIYYPTNGDGIRFMAYYPYGTVTDYKRTFSLTDQSTKAKKEAVDFGFYRGTTNYSRSNSTPALTFEHKFSKLLLTVKKGVDGPDVKNVTVKLSNTPSSAEVNLATLATTDASAVTTSGTADITAYTNSGAGTNDEVTVEAIVAPHSAKSGRVLTFTTSDKTRTYELDSSLAFEAGKVYTLDITLGGDPVEVTFPAGSLKESWSGAQATGASWTAGDAVGVYVLPAGGTVLSAAKENNRKYTIATDDGATLSDGGSAIYYPTNGDGIRFMAYYPYGTVTTDYKRTFDLTDQSTKAKKEAVDFGFYRGTTDYTGSSSTPALTFEHKFSKLLLTVKKGVDGPDVKNVAVKLSNTPSSAEVNLATLATTDASAITTSGTADITAYTNSGAGTNDEVTVEAIVAPHSGKSGRVLTFTVSDKTIRYELAGSLAFEAGKVYAFDITLKYEIAATDGMTNCYIVAPDTELKFPVSRAYTHDGTKFSTTLHAGGTYTSTFTAAVVWADAAVISSTPSVSVSGSGNSATVTLKTTATSGNAVVKICKTGDTTPVWSYHIWVTDYDPAKNTYTNTYNTNNQGKNFVFMDRNLGATKAGTGSGLGTGLFYQWGRKDPFPATLAPGDSQPGGGSFTAVVTSATHGTIENTIKNPGVFYWGVSGTDYDWHYASHNNDLWGHASDGGTKTIYDPCPSGWRVPVNYNMSYATSPWYGMISTGGFSSGYSWGTNALYPAAGYRYDSSGSLSDVGTYGLYWSASPYSSASSYASGLHFSSGSVYVGNSYYRATGLSVRCVQE
ncbi:MAG: fimbrillin family protein [Mediterranea sp.]|nr:fimbrillin family protein [Mediterranea sp.]